MICHERHELSSVGPHGRSAAGNDKFCISCWFIMMAESLWIDSTVFSVSVFGERCSPAGSRGQGLKTFWIILAIYFARPLLKLWILRQCARIMWNRLLLLLKRRKTSNTSKTGVEALWTYALTNSSFLQGTRKCSHSFQIATSDWFNKWLISNQGNCGLGVERVFSFARRFLSDQISSKMAVSNDHSEALVTVSSLWKYIKPRLQEIRAKHNSRLKHQQSQHEFWIDCSLFQH